MYHTISHSHGNSGGGIRNNNNNCNSECIAIHGASTKRSHCCCRCAYNTELGIGVSIKGDRYELVMLWIQNNWTRTNKQIGYWSSTYIAPNTSNASASTAVDDEEMRVKNPFEL